MIDYLTGGPHITVHNSYGSQPYVSPGNPMSGMMRYVNNRIEVYDGISWLQVAGSSTTITLNEDTIKILNWAKEKMDQEKEYLDLAKSHPGIVDLLDQVRDAEDRLRVFATLAKKEHSNG